MMDYMGHADLPMVQRYTKLLPQPDEDNPAQRLNAYLRHRKNSAEMRRRNAPARWTQVDTSVRNERL